VSAVTVTDHDRRTTLQYIRSRRLAEGFAPEPGAPAEVRASLMSMIVLKAWGGGAAEEDLVATRRFVGRCASANGAFSAGPSLEPSVLSTGVGLLAFAMTHERYSGSAPDPARYPWPPMALTEPEARQVCARTNSWLSLCVQTPEEIRLAVDVLERVGERPLAWPRWRDQLKAHRRQEALLGTPELLPRYLAQGVLPLVRMDHSIEDRREVVEKLQESQRGDGGYSSNRQVPSDLDSTYWTLRTLHALGERPRDVGGVSRFLERCRASDGGYGMQPGMASSIIGTGKAVKISCMLGGFGE
jgi:prenyltransferase beta subunit